MRSVKKMRAKSEGFGGWMTLNGNTWKNAGYDEDSVDAFGDVWLRPVRGELHTYETVDGDHITFVKDDSNRTEMKEVEER